MSKKRPLDPLEPGHIPGQNPATPERVPGHTRHYDKSSDQSAIEELKDQKDRDLNEALEDTFPASDPVSLEAPLVTRGRNHSRDQSK
jgi:hypothetical protein